MSIENKFCSRCGSPLQENALFCPQCGTSVPQPSATTATGTSTAPSSQPMDWREQRRQWRAQRRAERYEKYEKGEKHEEKTEKGRRGNVVGPIAGGLVLIWLGITFYMQQAGYLPSDNWWAYFIAGIGVIIIVQGLINYSMSRIPFAGSFIGGAILLIIGLAFISNIGVNFWPLILVVIGIAILISSLTARRRRPAPSTS